MMPRETVIPTTGFDLDLDPTLAGADMSRALSRKRLSKRKVGNLTCHEGEVEDLLSEGEST
jgi:hypothetical protein